MSNLAGVTAQTRKPAGRPPVFNGRNADAVLGYYSAVEREIPIPRGRPSKDSAPVLAKFREFNSKITARV